MKNLEHLLCSAIMNMVCTDHELVKAGPSQILSLKAPEKHLFSMLKVVCTIYRDWLVGLVIWSRYSVVYTLDELRLSLSSRTNGWLDGWSLVGPMRIRHSEQKLTHQDYSSKSTSLVYLLDLLVWTIEFYHKMLNLISPRAMTFDVYKGRANIYSEIIFFPGTLFYLLWLIENYQE